MAARKGLLPYLTDQAAGAEMCAQCGQRDTLRKPLVLTYVEWIRAPSSVVGVRVKLHVECSEVVRAWPSPKVLRCAPVARRAEGRS